MLYQLYPYIYIFIPCVDGFPCFSDQKQEGELSPPCTAPLPHPLLLHLGLWKAFFSPQENTVVLFNAPKNNGFSWISMDFNSTWILHLRNNTLF